MRAFRSIAVLSMLVLFLGLHWSALQAIAWTRMLFSYALSAPLRTAVSMTFDGNHPCGLCRAIQRGRESEGKQPLSVTKTAVRLECDLPADALEFSLRIAVEPPPVPGATWTSRSESPPKPRPRTVVIA